MAHPAPLPTQIDADAAIGALFFRQPLPDAIRIAESWAAAWDRVGQPVVASRYRRAAEFAASPATGP